MESTPIEENKVIELETDYKPGQISNPTSQEEDFKESPKKTLQKIDRRSITSKINAIKAREARARKRAEREQKMKELFGSSESEDSDTETESSDSDELVVPSKWSRKKKTKEQREIAELKSMLFKLAEKQKKSRRRSRRRNHRSPVKAQTPVINYTIAPPIQPQPIEKEEKKKSTFMDQLLKKRILEN